MGKYLDNLYLTVHSIIVVGLHISCITCTSFPVKEKFVVDKDSEVAATSMKVSLLCPVSCHPLQHAVSLTRNNNP